MLHPVTPFRHVLVHVSYNCHSLEVRASLSRPEVRGEGWELSGTQREAMVLGEGQVVHGVH